MRRFSSILMSIAVSAAALGLTATDASAQAAYDTTLYSALSWRMIGPYRGGRSVAAAGVVSDPMVYYFGGTGGGVWKTVDAGMTWQPISDETDMAGSIGAIAVAPSDANVVYVGTGEACPRGNVSPGNGVYRSTDAGKTWTHIGLPEAGQVGAVVVHPRDEDLVYVAALGHIFGPNEERGVYRSRDGGATWELILQRDENTGAIDLIMDPTNPRILYAALWQVRRLPHAMESGGPGSGIFKSTDGGDTWTEITRNEGLPEGTIGKVGIAVSPANPDRVWAIVEADEGGVFRSDDAGETWRRVNSDRKLRQRAWYYTHIYADPANEETVYVLNVGFYKSGDGGKTFDTRISVPHGDNHDLWIAPDDPNRMINANDGGANVSFNGGEGWTRQDNQPTAQMYHVTTTMDFPYKVCGAQQDNSTMCIASRTSGFGITQQDWHRVAGGESGYIAVRPDNTSISYGGSYGGYLTRLDRSTGQNRSVAVWPDNPMGWGADSLRYRFQWTFPIVLSPFDPDVMYVTSQHVHRTSDEGQTWETISPDLTRNDKDRQGPSGGPITKDNTSVEYYGTVFALVPSAHDPNVIWAGSDDGLVHVTRDGGQTWDDVTPRARDLPDWALISIIEESLHSPGTAYLAATRYKQDDFSPYIFKTTDYGQSWRKIVEGVPEGHFIRVVREDPERAGLLYAAGEFGVYVSFDAGAHWQSLQLDLPLTPIHDMVVKNNDLVVATHGRSFYILDDLTPLHELSDQVASSAYHLFTPRDAYRMRGFGGRAFPGVGANPQNGVWVHFYLSEEPAEDHEVVLEFLDAGGELIKRYSTKSKERGEELEVEAGANRFVWNTRYADATGFDGMIMWAGSTGGPRAVPGEYQVRLTVGDWSDMRAFSLLPDPRVEVSQADLEEQFDFLIRIRDRVSEANRAVERIRDIKKQLEGVAERAEGHSDADTISAVSKELRERLSGIEAEIYQVKNRSNQDPLNYPIRLNNKIAALTGVVSSADAKPTAQSYAVYEELSAQLQVQLDQLETIVEDEIPAFNDFVRERDIPAVLLRGEDATPVGMGRP
jgi:photosystem II stability/assembly factor-like uncharacterized protein